MAQSEASLWVENEFADVTHGRRVDMIQSLKCALL